MNELLRRLLALPPQASTVARPIDTLHYVVIICTMTGATVVFLMALIFLLRHRRRGPGEITPRIEPSAAGEGTLITGILGLFLVFWLVGYRQYVTLQVPPDDAIPIYVTGKQWMWKFSYPNGASDIDVLTVPVGRPVKLIMTSRDVIHDFFVPAFRVKQDVVPGRYLTTWFQATTPGTYEIFCAEYCGTAHSRMVGSVLALSPADYEAWLESGPRRDHDGEPALSSESTEGDLVREGQRVAVRRSCTACHTIDGQAHVGPTWSRLYGSRVRLADGREVVADEAYLTRSMMEPNVDLVAGYRPLMPTYMGVLTQPEVAALVELIKSLRDGPVEPTVILPAATIPTTSATAPPPAAPMGGGL